MSISNVSLIELQEIKVWGDVRMGATLLREMTRYRDLDYLLNIGDEKLSGWHCWKVV
jgi:hypothetical protein